jgi:hypothetical protein
VYVTSAESVIVSGSPIPDCNHEEADTRIVVHILHALGHGSKTVQVRRVDTDVVIILAGAFYELIKIKQLADVWIAFGMGKHCRSTALMPSVLVSEKHDLKRYQCSMKSLDAILCLPSDERARSQSGRPGRHTKR